MTPRNKLRAMRFTNIFGKNDQTLTALTPNAIDTVMAVIDAEVTKARLAGALDELMVMTNGGRTEPNLEIAKKRFDIKDKELVALKKESKDV